MTMMSGSVLGPSGGGSRRRRPWATAFLVILMMAVIFGGTYGAVVLLRGGDATPDAAGTTSAPAVCVSVTVTPGTSLPKPATVTVNVYNATDRAGLAKKTATDLKARGFGIGTVANDPLGKSLTTVGEIRYGATGLANARLLAIYVPGAVLVKDARTDTTVDVVLGQKYKAVAPQKTVDAVLAKPVVQPSGDGCASSTPTATPAGTGTAKATTSPSPS